MKTTLSADYVLNRGPLWKLTDQYVAAIDDWNVLRNAGYARFAPGFEQIVLLVE